MWNRRLRWWLFRILRICWMWRLSRIIGFGWRLFMEWRVRISFLYLLLIGGTVFFMEIILRFLNLLLLLLNLLLLLQILLMLLLYIIFLKLNILFFRFIILDWFLFIWHLLLLLLIRFRVLFSDNRFIFF